MKQVELSIEELSTLAVVVTSPWSVAEAVYQDKIGRERLAGELTALQDKILPLLGISVRRNENQTAP